MRGRFLDVNLFTLLKLKERNFLCERIIKKIKKGAFITKKNYLAVLYISYMKYIVLPYEKKRI